jgi:hypothetical protein
VRAISKDAFGSVIPTGHRAFDRIADDCVVGRRNHGSEALQYFKPASRDENLLRSVQVILLRPGVIDKHEMQAP